MNTFNKLSDKYKHNNMLIFLSFLFFSLVQVKPFVTKNLMLKNWGNIDDINFHITRLVGLNHVLTNPINYLNFGQTGNGTNLFYPWVFYYPASLLSKLFNSYSVGYILWLAIITFVSFIIAFYCGKSFFNSIGAGYLFSILYVFSNNRIMNGYTVNDLGHFIVITFLPLVFLYWYKIVFKKGNNWVGLAVSMSLVVYSHVLTTILTIIFLLVMSLIWYKATFNKKVITQFVKAVLLTSTLTAFFWVSLLQQILLVKPVRPTTTILQLSASSLSDCVKYSLSNSIDPGTFSIGIIGLFTLIISSFLLKKTSNLFISVYLLSLITYLISTNLFPWAVIQKTPLNIIQYTGRLNEFTSLFLSALLILVLKRLSMFTAKNIILVTLLTTILSVTTSSLFVQSKSINASKIYSNDNFVSISRKINTIDYYPHRSSVGHVIYSPIMWGYVINENIINKQYFINNINVKLNVHPYDTKVLINLNQSKKAYKLNTPILYYEGSMAKFDGKQVAIKQSDRGTILVNVPKNGHKLEITNEYTKLAKFSALVSLVTLGSIVIYELKKLFLRRKN